MMPVEQSSKHKNKGHNQPVKSLPKAIKVAESLSPQGEAGNFELITGKKTC